MSPTLTSFSEIADFDITPEVATGFATDGIVRPTAVQAACIGPILSGRHVVIESGTGTGKTLGYLLPLLQLLRRNSESRAVCFSPATELAVQIRRVAERYKEPSIRTMALVSTANQRYATEKLERSVRFIAGTPGRILEMYEKRKLKGVNIVILDEPEPILSSPHANYLWEVLSRPEPKLQLVVAGATYGSHAERFIERFLGPEVVRAKVDDSPLESHITHQRIDVRNEGEKDYVLGKFVAKHPRERTMIFVNQPSLLRHLYRYLTELGLAPVTVGQERSKLQREQAMRDFSSGKASVLLTTDEAATGLDVADVAWVLHFELPSSGKAYIHRAGRTGRAGKTGRSVLFVSASDRGPLRRLEQELGFSIGEPRDREGGKSGRGEPSRKGSGSR